MKPRYVLITPARNEERFIEGTIRAVIAQELPPLRWVIVSDGSTDRTEAIVSDYARRHGFIRLLRRERSAGRDFSSKVEAIRAGFEQLRDLDYGYYGNLDADVTFEADYYRRVLEWMEGEPRLGVAGGRVHDYVGPGRDGRPRYRRQSADPASVAGPIQMFRRACWEEIGGYPAVRGGLVDAIAEVTARMRGWETRTREDLPVRHHRLTGSEGRGAWARAADEGARDYAFGCHPLWNAARAAQRFLHPPLFLGSLLRLWGYWSRALLRRPRPVTPEFVRFLRREEGRKARRPLASLRRMRRPGEFTVMSRPLRIAQLTPYYHPSIGGVEGVVRYLAEELVRRGHSVDVLTADRLHRGTRHDPLPREEVLQGVRVRRFLPLLTLGHMSLCPGEVPALWKGGYDLLHAHVYRQPQVGLASAVGRLRSVPLILHGHGPFDLDPSSAPPSGPPTGCTTRVPGGASCSAPTRSSPSPPASGTATPRWGWIPGGSRWCPTPPTRPASPTPIPCPSSAATGWKAGGSSCSWAS